MNDQTAYDFSLAYYYGDRKTGSIAVVSCDKGNTSVAHVKQEPETGLGPMERPVFIGLTETRNVILLDPRARQIVIQDGFPVDAFPAHIYPQPDSAIDWFMNDGDKETGNDPVNCGDRGSSVTVVENTASDNARFLKTVCVGRGHHQAEFIGPSAGHPDIPRVAYISNLKDGTITAIGNDPEDKEKYLSILSTINLCQPEKENATEAVVPNNAFPHGLVYSPLAGKLYCLNNGYGTVAVIDPVTNTIEDRLDFKGHSNLFAAPGGRFLIGRGADRKSDSNHVIAKLSVIDTKSNTIVSSTQLVDIYVGKYFFNPEGTRLYLTTAASGSPEQQVNLKSDALLVFDVTALPEIKLVAELRLGSSAGTLDFLSVDGRTRRVFSSNSEEGVVAVIDPDENRVLEKIRVNDGTAHSRLWLLSGEPA
jgi:hypothetical protein